MSSSTDTITLTKANNVGINNNTYQYNFKQGSYRIEENSEICVNKAVIPNSVYNITGNNNSFYYTLPIYTNGLSSSTTITGYIQGDYAEITSITNGTLSVGEIASCLTPDLFLKSQVQGTSGNIGIYTTNSATTLTTEYFKIPAVITDTYLNTSAKMSQFIPNYTFTRTNNNALDTMPQDSFTQIYTNLITTTYNNITYTNISGWSIVQNNNYAILVAKGNGGALGLVDNSTNNTNLGYCCNALGIQFATNYGGSNRYATLTRSSVPITASSTFEFSFYCGCRYAGVPASYGYLTATYAIIRNTSSGPITYNGSAFNPPTTTGVGFLKFALPFPALAGETIDIRIQFTSNWAGQQDNTPFISKLIIRDTAFDNRALYGANLAPNTILSNAYTGFSTLFSLTNTQTSTTAYATTPTTSYFSTGNTLTTASAITGVVVGDLVISTTYNAFIPYGTYIQSIVSSTQFVLANDNLDLFITPFGSGVGTLISVSFYHSTNYSFDSAAFIPFTSLVEQSAYKVSLTEGYYDITSLNTALATAQSRYNTVFSNTVSKQVLYPLQLSYNTTLLRSTLSAIFIPTNASNVLSQQGANWVWALGVYPSISYSGRLFFDNSTIATLLGVSLNAFTPSSLTVYDSNNPFPLLTNSINVPFYQTVNAILLRCNLVNNNVEATSDIVGTIPILQSFESNINYNPNKYCWVKIRSGINSSLVLTLTDQYKNPLILNDNNVLIQLLIRKI